MIDINSEMCIFSPSLICLDMCNLEAQVKELENSGIRMLHIDILDGYFSPSMPLGLDLVRQIRKKTDMFFDCHIMTQRPDFFVDELINIGVQQINFQIETCDHIDGMLNKIRDAGIRAGVALKPATPLYSLEYILEKCDSFLLMLINPGYASAKIERQVQYADRKIKALHQMIQEKNTKTRIEIDGRISLDNIKTYGKEIVSIFVCGTTCFSKDNIKQSADTLYALRKQILG